MSIVSDQRSDLVVPVSVLTIDKVTGELETGIVEGKVDSSSTLIFEPFHGLPQPGRL